MSSLIYRTQAYLIKATREARIRQIGPATWEAQSPSLGITAQGDSRDEAEYNLHAKISVYVYGAHMTGMRLPVIDGVALEDVSAVDSTEEWTEEWRAGIDEAIRQHEAGLGTVYETGTDFLAALDRTGI